MLFHNVMLQLADRGKTDHGRDSQPFSGFSTTLHYQSAHRPVESARRNIYDHERLINTMSEQYILNTISQSFVWWLLAALAFSESMKPQHAPNPTSSS